MNKLALNADKTKYMYFSISKEIRDKETSQYTRQI